MNGMETSMNRVTKKTTVLLAAAAWIASATACGRGHEPAATDMRETVTVEVASAEAQAFGQGLEVSAGVVPLQRATLGTVLMGRVEEVLVREGDGVSGGQVLARIDNRDVAAKVAQAEANVAAARAMEHNARLMLERMQRLAAKQAATQRDLDDATAGYSAAQANLEAAEEGVKAARSYLAYAEVRAPFGGRITDRRVDVGDLASPGMPLFTIEDTTRVKVEAEVPESVAIRVGDPVEVEVAGRRHAARLDEVVTAADPRSRTFTVRAVLPNQDGGLRSGLFARMWVGSQASDVVAVPESALVRRGPLTGVYVVDTTGQRSRARLRWITLGRSRDGMREVLTGLSAGESFVVSPPAELADGSPVEVRG